MKMFKNWSKDHWFGLGIYIILGANFVWWIIDEIKHGHSFFYALFIGVIMTILLFISLGLLYVVGWRLLTPEGREQERDIQARLKIKKETKKREKAWERAHKL